MMTRAKATAEGYLWNHAGRVLEYLLLFVITILIARGLGVEGNGVYATLTSFAQLLVVFSSLSLESSLNRYIPQLEAGEQRDSRSRLRFMLRRVFLVRGGLLAVAVLLAYLAIRLIQLPVPGAVVGYFWVLAGYAMIRSCVQLLNMVFVAQLRTASLARVAVSVRLCEAIGIAAMLTVGMSVASMMLFLISTGTLQAGACLYIGRSDFFGEVRPHSLRPVYAFGAIYWTNTIFEYFLGRQGDVLFLTTLLSSPAPASMYNVAFSVVLVAAQGLTLGLSGITLTSFSRLAATSPQTMDRFYGFLVRMVSILVVPVLVFMFFNADAIVTILFSRDYSAAAILVQGMVLFRVAARLFGTAENSEYLLAKGQVFRAMRLGVAGALTNIVLDLILIPPYGALGAVIGSGCANLLANILGAFAVRKQAGRAVIQWRYWGLLTLSAVLAGVISWSLLPGGGWTPLLGRAIMFGGITILLLYLVKPFPALDARWVSQVNEPLARFFGRFTRPHADPALQAT